jgi:hypothetical protein
MLVCPERSLVHESPAKRSVIEMEGATGDAAGVLAPGLDHRDPPGLLLVGVRETDVETTLADAVGRARCEGRALLVALVRPQAPLSTDAVIQQRAADRAARDLVRRRVLVRATCAEAGVRLDDIRTIAQPWRLGPRRQERALRRRLRDLARVLRAELHPLPTRHGADDVGRPERPPASTRSTLSTTRDTDGRVG